VLSVRYREAAINALLTFRQKNSASMFLIQ